MSKKKRKFESNIPTADKWMSNMKFKDLKRECVVRGMDFNLVLNSSIYDLQNFLRDNFHEKTNHSLLDSFDDWQETLIIENLAKKGEDPSNLIHPSLRLGYIAEKDEDGKVTKRKRVKVIVAKVKKKRDRTEEGLFSGTKKAMTFQLQKEGYSKEETIKMVMLNYKDASEKSIGIWYNKARKLHGK